MLYKNDKERYRAAVFYFTSAAASLLLAYPIMGSAMLLGERLSVDQSVAALLGGGALLASSMLAGRWIGPLLFPQYYTDDGAVWNSGFLGHAV
jgi:hypothetical protein